MPKVNGRYKKKPYIPNYNPQVLKPGQVGEWNHLLIDVSII